MRQMWVVVLSVLSLTACGGKSKGSSSAVATPPPVAPYGGGPSAYPGSVLNPDVALNGMGQWITIGGQRFFVPASRYTGAGWEPYQNGHWMYDQRRGWTWVSEDRFGWLTDHYGVWRHHGRYGWVWMPFHDMHYEPHCVTWFDQGDSGAYLGWYPYNSGYSRGYVLDYRHGFDDGYWRGERAVLDINVGGFHLGLSLVNRADACEPNVRRHIVRDRRTVVDFAFGSFRDRDQRRFDSRFPGGSRDRAYNFMGGFSRSRPMIGESRTVRSEGGARFLQPEVFRRGERRFEPAKPAPQPAPAPVPAPVKVEVPAETQPQLSERTDNRDQKERRRAEKNEKRERKEKSDEDKDDDKKDD